MFKKFEILVLALVISLILPLSVFAHPGRTDANGCHTCRTNCESWGLKYGEYHCHGGNVKETVKEVKNTAKTEAKKIAKTKSK
jgi:hypothetical protein